MPHAVACWRWQWFGDGGSAPTLPRPSRGTDAGPCHARVLDRLCHRRPPPPPPQGPAPYISRLCDGGPRYGPPPSSVCAKGQSTSASPYVRRESSASATKGGVSATRGPSPPVAITSCGATDGNGARASLARRGTPGQRRAGPRAATHFQDAAARDHRTTGETVSRNKGVVQDGKASLPPASPPLLAVPRPSSSACATGAVVSVVWRGRLSRRRGPFATVRKWSWKWRFVPADQLWCASHFFHVRARRGGPTRARVPRAAREFLEAATYSTYDRAQTTVAQRRSPGAHHLLRVCRYRDRAARRAGCLPASKSDK